jgi:hypothetical protein
MNKILHLTLLRKWFIEILEGRKVEEYREIKPYWTKRLFDSEGVVKNYDVIVFRNGYAKDAPEMKVEFKGVRVEKDRYVILLGDVLEKKGWGDFRFSRSVF